MIFFSATFFSFSYGIYTIAKFFIYILRFINSKTNILGFSKSNMTFHREEICMVKTIGGFTKIYSSERAQKLGITRIVVQRIIRILVKCD